ncbi:MAG: AtzE family amidohydrolase [SAR324 cluster bacterium]|nr:AtzE family amidohydrolase [SAR324 cluster bacterium]
MITEHTAAHIIAAAVRSGEVQAGEVVAAALKRVAARDHALNCFTALTAEQALADAARIDGDVAAGRDPGPLAGVPFAVKNLFAVAGLPTLAGSKINAERPPALRDAAAVAALRRAGAVLVGALNMDEYAFGFTTENTHYGATRNPHDPDRMAGGSSGGSAAAVAAGLVPLALGSDTNGSIRVPASLCGVFGLKPTYGRLSRAGAALFSFSLDHIGPLARAVRDVALAFDLLQGPDSADPVCSQRPAERVLPHLGASIADLRIAVADGYFAEDAAPEALEAVERVARALGAERRVNFPQVPLAGAAASIITHAEGSNVHLEDLRIRPDDFDPMTRDRFLAGALVPGAWLVQARRFRRWFRERALEVFAQVDLVLTPTTPFAAPPIGQARSTVAGREVFTRAHVGAFTRPWSFIGFPAMSLPVQQPGGLPLGVQLVAAPYNEAWILRVAAALETDGVVAAPAVTDARDDMAGQGER